MRATFAPGRKPRLPVHVPPAPSLARPAPPPPLHTQGALAEAERLAGGEAPAVFLGVVAPTAHPKPSPEAGSWNPLASAVLCSFANASHHAAVPRREEITARFRENSGGVTTAPSSACAHVNSTSEGLAEAITSEQGRCESLFRYPSGEWGRMDWDNQFSETRP